MLSLIQVPLASASSLRYVRFNAEGMSAFSSDFVEKYNTRYYKVGFNGEITGDIEGVFDWSDRYIFRCASPPPEDPICSLHKITITISGNIEDKQGTLTICANVYFKYDDAGVSEQKWGTWRIVRGSGELSNFRGSGKLTWGSPYMFEGTIYEQAALSSRRWFGF